MCAIVARKKGLIAPFRVKGFWLVAVIGIFGLGVIFWRLAMTNQKGIIMCLIWIVLGVIVYLIFNKSGLKKTCNVKGQVETIDDMIAKQNGAAAASVAAAPAAKEES